MVTQAKVLMLQKQTMGVHMARHTIYIISDLSLTCRALCRVVAGQQQFMVPRGATVKQCIVYYGACIIMACLLTNPLSPNGN